MKLILTISAMILFLITGCESGKQPANDFLTVVIRKRNGLFKTFWMWNTSH